MPSTLIWILVPLCAALGWALGWYLSRARLGAELSVAHAAVTSAREIAQAREAELGRQRQQELELTRRVSQSETLALRAEQAMKELTETRILLETARTAVQLLEQQLKSQRDHLDETRKHSREEFQNLAQQILEAKTKTFTESTEKNLGLLLTPLREKLGLFEKKVDENYANEAKERHTLKAEITRLMGLNEQLGREAQSLTQALKGDSKVQGDWGELVLTRILEASGLREGQEYETQAHHTSEEGERFRPDVVIRLPEGKHLVIDSKVSLTAYELHARLENGPERERALAAHLTSLNKHVNDLADKQYAKLKGINSPELVFLFVPIESAYVLAMQSDPELATRAMRKNVAIVTATTLFTSLKTVASIWKLENQNRNALEIASEGAKLYDKFVGFLEDFEKVGKTLESGHAQYTSALGKLKEGPGNVFRKIELLRELGAAPNKRIRPDLLE